MSQTTNNKINFPHDHYFKSMMVKPKIIKEFFQQYLPVEIKNLLNFATIKHQNSSYISDELKKQEADLLFSVKMNNNQPGYIYILLEHQSTPDKFLAFRILKYMVSIMEDHLKKNKNQELPVIYPLVFYTGSKEYTYAADLFDLFGGNKKIAMDIMYKPFHLIDLNKISDEKLQLSLLFGVVARILKHAHEKNAVDFLKTVMKDLRTIANLEGIEYIYATITYVINTYDISRDDFTKIIKNELPFVSEEKIMTIAEQYRQEGVQQGLNQGMQQGIIQGLQQGYQKGEHIGKEKALKNVALKLLGSGMAVDQTSAITGLSMSVIEQLQVNASSIP
jgi:predicted transposase/invertase (TIGR01784 family)